MGMFPEPRAGDRLPVSLVTGFLGSGKTTLLNHLLRHPGLANTAIVINEFGDTPLDQHFIERSDGEVVVMANGCLCCTVQGDLEGVVGTIFARRASGAVPRFDRLVIETTGLADPAPIMQVLLDSPLLVNDIGLDSVITTVDAVNGARQMCEHAEAVKQVAVADRLILTKTDLADSDTTETARALLARLNPSATLFRLHEPDFAPPQLFGAALVGSDGAVRDHRAWLGDAARHGHDDDRHGHLQDVVTFTLEFPERLAWPAFQRWLTRLKVRHADRLLRVKGIVHLAGEDGPVAIHGVHHVFHPPVRLPRRPGDDTTSRIVFITRGLTRATVEAEWRDFHAPAMSAVP